MNPLFLLRDLFFPRLCNACTERMQAYENLICVNCQLNLPKIPLEKHIQQPLNSKFWGKIPVKNTYSFLHFTKNGSVQHLLHQLKYRNKPQLAEYLGNWFGRELKDFGIGEEIDLILGVPLHPKKKKMRGYNQADCFAKGLAAALQIAHDEHILERNVFTDTQTRKSRFQRYENVEGVFSVKQPEKIRDKRVALVDDILTTGATLEAVGVLLLEAGCKELTIFTIAAA